MYRYKYIYIYTVFSLVQGFSKMDSIFIGGLSSCEYFLYV